MTTPPPSDPSDELAAALGRFVREHEAEQQAGRPPEWEAALTGELEFEQALARRREAQDAPEQLERAAAMFRPFDAGETNALVDGLLASISSQDGSEGEDQSNAEAAAPLAEVIPLGERKASGTASADKPSPATSDTRESSPWWIPGGMLAAAAAAILMWWVWPPSSDIHGPTEPKIAQLEPLPAYGLELDGGLVQLRGSDTADDPQGPASYRRDTVFNWLLRPEVDVGESVGVRGFVFVAGGSAGLPLELTPLVQTAPSGVIRVSGEISRLELEPGRYTIVLAVGRPDDLPTQAAQVAAPTPEGAWQVHRVEIDIQD